MTPPMVLDADLAAALARSEDSSCQFKADAHNVDALATELAAFANAQGGTLYLGVDDAGRALGLAPDDVRRLNQLIANAATQDVRSPLVVQTRNHPVGDGRSARTGGLRQALLRPPRRDLAEGRLRQTAGSHRGRAPAHVSGERPEPC